MHSNQPINRPARITAAQLGMFSLGPDDSTQPIDQQNVERLRSLTTAIARAFVPQSLSALELELGIVATQRNLDVPTRRANVIDELLNSASLDQRLKAIDQINFLDPTSRDSYKNQIDLLITDLLASQKDSYVFRGIDLVGELFLEEQFKHINWVFSEASKIAQSRMLNIISGFETPHLSAVLERLVDPTPDISVVKPSSVNNIAWNLLEEPDPLRQSEILKLAVTFESNSEFYNYRYTLISGALPEVQAQYLEQIIREFILFGQFCPPDWPYGADELIFDLIKAASRLDDEVQFRLIQGAVSELPAVCIREIWEMATKLDEPYQLDALVSIISQGALVSPGLIDDFLRSARNSDMTKRALVSALSVSKDENFLTISHQHLDLLSTKDFSQVFFENPESIIQSYGLSSRVFSRLPPESITLVMQYALDRTRDSDQSFEQVERALNLVSSGIRALDPLEVQIFVNRNEDYFVRQLETKTREKDMIFALAHLDADRLQNHIDIFDRYFNEIAENDLHLAQLYGMELALSHPNLEQFHDLFDEEQVLDELLRGPDFAQERALEYAIRNMDPRWVTGNQVLHTAFTELLKNSDSSRSRDRLVQLLCENPELSKAEFLEETKALIALESAARFPSLDRVNALLKLTPVETRQELFSTFAREQTLSELLFDIDDISTLFEPAALAKSAIELVNNSRFGIGGEEEGLELIKQLPTKEKIAAIHALKSDLGGVFLSRFANIPFADNSEKNQFLNQARQHREYKLGAVIRTLDETGKQLLREQLDAHIQDSTRSILHDLAGEQPTALEKTGSATTILSSHLESSVRTVDAPTAHAWASTYLSASYWKEAGFDYIPVEPILDITPSENGTLNVTTVNLRGRSLNDSQILIALYPDDIQGRIKDQKDLIMEMLDSLGVWHGHAHDGNFVLVPRLDDEGRVDFASDPRIYVIDFDRAHFLQNAPILDGSSSAPTPKLSTSNPVQPVVPKELGR